MAFTPSIILPDDVGKSAEILKGLVMEVGLGIAIVLHDDAQNAFDQLRAQSGNPRFNVTTVWAKTDNAINGAKSILDLLPNGDKVSYEQFGHRVVSVNKVDAVSRVLSRLEADDALDVMDAFFCAAGKDICGF